MTVPECREEEAAEQNRAAVLWARFLCDRQLACQPGVGVNLKVVSLVVQNRGAFGTLLIILHKAILQSYRCCC
jgi:hypothetical protein